MKKRRASEEEIKLFKAVIDGARPAHAPPRAKIKPPAKIKVKAARAAKIPARAAGLNASLENRLRRGALAPQARLDLHGLTEAAAYRALLPFLCAAQRKGAHLVLIITGKGAPPAPDAPFDLSSERRGVLKSAVPRWLGEAPFAALIAAVRPAHRRHGAGGALYVYLRKTS
jgi:DNA-nicking Smr family endonuclease